MSDCEWDADDFEPVAPDAKPVATDKWEGEDEDDGIKDNWDDEDDEEKKEGGDEVKAVQVKKKKGLQARLAEKEAKKKQLEQERREQAEAARIAAENMTPEERAAEQARRKQAQEDADLEMARLTFGDDLQKPTGEIDGFRPVTESEFEKFRTLLTDKICKFDKSPHYVTFVETLARELCLGVDPEDIKKISSSLTAVANEKTKLVKPAKKKGKKGKATLAGGKDNTLDDYVVDDMYDDYM